MRRYLVARRRHRFIDANDFQPTRLDAAQGCKPFGCGDAGRNHACAQEGAHCGRPVHAAAARRFWPAKGLARLAYAGDYMSHYPTGGIGTTDEKIKPNLAEVLSFIRASQRGINYYVQNRAEAIEPVIKYIGIKEPTLAAEVVRSPCQPAQYRWRTRRNMDARGDRFHREELASHEGYPFQSSVRSQLC